MALHEVLWNCFAQVLSLKTIQNTVSSTRCAGDCQQWTVKYLRLLLPIKTWLVITENTERAT